MLLFLGRYRILLPRIFFPGECSKPSEPGQEEEVCSLSAPLWVGGMAVVPEQVACPWCCSAINAGTCLAEGRDEATIQHQGHRLVPTDILFSVYSSLLPFGLLACDLF